MTTEDEDMILHLRIKFSMKNGVQILPPYIEKSLSRVDSPSTSETEHPVATATEVQSMLSLLTSLVTGAVNHSEQSLQQLSNIGSGPLMGEKKKGEDGSEVRDHNRGGIAETNMEVDADNLAGDLVNRQVGGAPRTPPRQDETHSDVQSPVRDRSQPVSAESRRQSSRSRSISKERIVSPRSTSSSLGHPPPISPTATKQSFDRQPTLPSHSPIKPRSTRQSHQAPSQQPSNQQQLASSRARLPSESYYSQSDKYQHPKPEQVSVCVFNLPYDIDFEHVKRIFTERCGEISRSNFVCDWSTGQKRFTGRCFLDFVDETASEKALKLDGFVLSGRTVRVCI
ncbi:hypothetical protein BKA69DRAFT_279203 [Paraphysoderma sedebokerense]|nr:hypothetical protein BKA69DRAFT_279203 [Paraphysoderma sedebokerense]